MESGDGVRVKITVGDAVVEIEGKDIAGISQIVETIKGVLQTRNSSPKQRELPQSQDYPVLALVPTARPDIKSFFGEKGPITQIEAAATVAFFLAHIETDEGKKSETINTERLMDELRKAQFPLPKTPKQVLVDAKLKGYFDNAGTGQYRLNSVGYNLVAFGLNSAGSTRETKSAKRGKSNGKR